VVFENAMDDGIGDVLSQVGDLAVRSKTTVEL
jgi:hypothetical protein